MSETTDLLIPIETPTDVATFTNPAAFEEMYRRIREITDAHIADISTNKGRDEIRSLAHKVSKTKAALDNAGKELTEDWRKKTGTVNAARKNITTKLDALRDEVRKPLTDWEEAEKKREENVKAVLAQIAEMGNIPHNASPAWIVARLAGASDSIIGDDFGDYAEPARAGLERARKILTEALEVAEKREAEAAELDALRAEKAKRDEEDRQRREAEEQAAREKAMHEDAMRRVAEDIEKLARVERAAIEAEANRKVREAEERARYEIETAERARREQAAKEAQERVAREAKEARERAEKAAKARNEEHRRRVNFAASEALAKHGPVDDETAERILGAIIDGHIPHVSLTY